MSDDPSYDIRPDSTGALDEVVARDVVFFHLERMNDGAWWMRLTFADGTDVDVNLTTRRNAAIDGRAEVSRALGRKP